MKRWLLPLAIVAVAAAAEEKFSRTIRPDDFSAAGLTKLSAEEVARLDALVRDYKSGALERARGEAVAAEARARQAEAKAAAANPVPAGGGGQSLLAKARVLLTPGTEIEYTTVESRIAGEFRGWESRTVFTLENGQRWQVAGTESYAGGRPVQNPAVKITPGALGTFWLSVEGVRPRAKVVLVGSGK